mmetsp:Transcript_23258/g.33811  ORF Transcript_23258/g.33811 Transcript_23258/m.33811 type:complete len:370 (-) Transcript_23258:24-1133(-)
MIIHDAADDHGQHLARGHDDGEDDGAELLDGVVDEELAGGGAHAEGQDVHQRLRVAAQEAQRLDALARLQQGDDGEEHGEAVDAKHHLELVHVVGAVHAGLPLAGEAVAGEVHGQEEDAHSSRDLLRVALLVGAAGLLGQREDGHAQGDEEGLAVLHPVVGLAVHHLAHQHHRDHLARLRHHLHGEGDVLEALVLRPAAQHVGQRARRVPVEGGAVLQLLALEVDGVVEESRGHKYGQEPVAEHTERGTGEHASSVGRGHHLLLQHPPGEERDLESDKTGGKNYSFALKGFFRLFRWLRWRPLIFCHFNVQSFHSCLSFSPSFWGFTNSTSVMHITSHVFCCVDFDIFNIHQSQGKCEVCFLVAWGISR